MFDSIFDSIVDAAGSIWSTGKQLESTKNQMAFQERMARNAHQYEVEDLIAAGLNPMLALNKGAATPSGASSGPIENPTKGFSALNLQRKLQKEQIDNIRFDNNLKFSQTGVSDTQARINKANAESIESTLPAVASESAARIAESIARIKSAEIEGEIDSSDYGRVMRYIDRGTKAVSSASEAKRSFNPAETRHRSRSSSENILYRGD